MTVQRPYTLQWDAHSPPKICPFPWGDLDPHLIHGCRAYPSPQPKRHSIGAAVFAGLTSVTDGQTDRQTTLLGR